MTTRCADQLTGFMTMVRKKLIGSEVLHSDETGINVSGMLHWLHTSGNRDYTYLFPHDIRGSKALDEMGIITDFKGVSVHDFWKPYEKYGCSHAYCNAHLIRELIFANENLEQEWAGKLIRLLLKIKEAVDKSERGYLEEVFVDGFTWRYKKLSNKPLKQTPSKAHR